MQFDPLSDALIKLYNAEQSGKYNVSEATAIHRPYENSGRTEGEFQGPQRVALRSIYCKFCSHY